MNSRWLSRSKLARLRRTVVLASKFLATFKVDRRRRSSAPRKTDCTGRASFQGFSLSLTAASDAEAERLFAALSDGGQVQMPLGKTFFASAFGMVADRFGVSWMVVAGTGKTAATSGRR